MPAMVLKKVTWKVCPRDKVEFQGLRMLSQCSSTKLYPSPRKECLKRCRTLCDSAQHVSLESLATMPSALCNIRNWKQYCFVKDFLIVLA